MSTDRLPEAATPGLGPRGSSAPVQDPWGRTAGQAPPVRPSWPWWWLLALGGVLTLVVGLLVRPPGPLDEPDLAYQRDGLLRNGPMVPPEVGGVPFGRRTVVLVFDREAPDAGRLLAWRSGLATDRDVRLVLPAAPAAGAVPPSLPVVVDPAGELARAVALPVPVDRGRGIGYAVVDRDRTVRYSTLDPSWLDNAFEVATVATAVS